MLYLLSFAILMLTCYINAIPVDNNVEGEPEVIK